MNPKTIIFFDGVCNLCNFTVNILIDLDKKNNLMYSSLQSEFAKQTLKAEQSLDSVLVLKNGQIYKKSSAVFEILSSLGGAYKIALLFKFLPRFILDWFYDIIAKNRYKLFGKTESCRIPTSELKAKFLS
jgi:predicted DCC family thiol-disulfide oxidoreductase YuxK